jgi:membrane fusion protein, multidrug efflux system
MNEMKATTTGTTVPDQVSSPKPEVHRETEGLNVEVRPQGPTETGCAAGESPRAPRRSSRASNRIVLALLGAAVTTAAAWSAYRWWEYSRTWVKTDNAYVAAHVHQVSSRVAGTVSEVLVEENQLVTAGQLLARLDARDFEVKRQQALALSAQARAQVQQAQARIAQAQSEVTREQVRATKAQQDLERAKQLSQGGNAAISRQEFDTAQALADGALAGLQSAKSALQSAEAATGAAEAQVKVAEANVKEAELQLSYTEIPAPAAGRIGKKNLETGNRVQPGQALLALVQPDVWVTANFKETQLDRVRPGQPVRVRVDAFPGRVLVGRVESIAPASGSQFALLPPDNATGNFTKIIQRLPVKIPLDDQTASDCQGRLAPGMSVIVEIKVGD